MLHPDTELRFINDEIGIGVFATKLIRKGTMTWVRDSLDMELSPQYVQTLDPLRQKILLKYAYMANGNYVLCWDHGRYVNHSSFPNMVATPYGFELAVKDIMPGEELRCDYATLGIEYTFKIALERDSFRTQIKLDDYLYLYKKWDEMAREAFKFFNCVDQPLRYLIDPVFVDKVSSIAVGQAEPESFLALFGRGSNRNL